MEIIPAKRDIKKVLEKETINEMIEEIFNQVITVRNFEKNTSSLGFYINLENVDEKELHSIFKMFYICRKKAVKLIQGDINNADKEGNQSQVLEYIFIVFNNVFNGLKNDKLETALQINGVEDIRRILSDEKLSKRLANYMITYVELLIQTYIKRKDNPDFYVEKRKYVPVYYNFIDDSNSNLKEVLENAEYEFLTGENGEILTEREIDQLNNENSELTDYIITNYIDKITGKQKEYIDSFLKYSNNEKRLINHDNEIIYSSRSAYYFNSRLKEILEKLLEEDKNIKIINNKYSLEK